MSDTKIRDALKLVRELFIVYTDGGVNFNGNARFWGVPNVLHALKAADEALKEFKACEKCLAAGCCEHYTETVELKGICIPGIRQTPHTLRECTALDHLSEKYWRSCEEIAGQLKERKIEASIDGGGLAMTKPSVCSCRGHSHQGTNKSGCEDNACPCWFVVKSPMKLSRAYLEALMASGEAEGDITAGRPPSVPNRLQRCGVIVNEDQYNAPPLQHPCLNQLPCQRHNTTKYNNKVK